MIVTACLAFYAEPPEFLDRCVRSLAPFCDRLVALGGRWNLFPAVTDSPPHEEITAIERAAYETGLDLTLGDGSFASQVAKRDALMQLARSGSDWLLVIDGDEHLQPIGGWVDGLKLSLDATQRDVAELLLRPMNQGWPLREMPANLVKVRRLYRAGVRCPGPAHNLYEFDGRYLAGDPMRVKLEPTLDVSSLLEIHHDNQNRGQARDDAAKAYRRDRCRERTEAWT